MPIQKFAAITASFSGDGTSTTATLNLLTDFYVVSGSALPVNWFSESLRTIGPIEAKPGDSSEYTVSLSGTVLTITFATAPPSAPGATTATIFLYFA